MKTPFLQGPNVTLRPLVSEDVAGPYVSWLNDAEVCAGNGHHLFPYTTREALDYVEQVQKSRDKVVLAVTLEGGKKHIGNVALQKIHPVYQSAELAILIGDKKSWGKGYSREACRLLLDHAFGTLNLHRVYCGTFETNVAMQKLAESLGMREEGRRRQEAFKDNRFLDVIEYGVLRDEYLRRKR